MLSNHRIWVLRAALEAAEGVATLNGHIHYVGHGSGRAITYSGSKDMVEKGQSPTLAVIQLINVTNARKNLEYTIIPM